MLLKQIMSVFSSKIGVVITTLLTSVLLARGLGVEDRGLLASIVIFPQLLITLFEGGMRQSATYYVSSNRIIDEKVIGSIIIYWLVVSSLGFVINYFLVGSFVDPVNGMVLVTASLIMPLEVFCSFFRGYYLGKENYTKHNFILVIPKFICLIAITVFYFNKELNVYYALLAMLFGGLANAFFILFQIFIKDRVSVEFSFFTLKLMFSKGIYYALALFFIVANYKIDILLLSQLSSNSETGLYTVVTQISESLWQLPAAIVVVLMSKSANRYNINSSEKSIQKTIVKTSRLTFWVTSFLAGLLLMIAPDIIPFVFGGDYHNASEILPYILPGIIAMVYFKIINADYAGNGNPNKAIYIMIPATAINIILNYILIPDFGAKGAAMASSISYIFSALCFTIIYKNEHNLNYINYFFCLKKGE